MNRKVRKRGEGYIDVCVGVLVFVMILVMGINIFSFVTLRQDLDVIAAELVENAAFSGCFGDEFYERNEQLQEQYFTFDTTVSATQYYNATYSRVQLGDTMTVKISADTNIKGFGAINIPVTVSVTKSAVSEKYWK